MNTSELDKSNLAQQGFTETSAIASLPDVDQLTKLANELFSALPCDGSRLGIAASAIPSGLASPLAGLDKAGVTAIAPQASGLPGESELRQLFAPRSNPSFERVPHHLDTGPVLGNPSSAATGGLTSSLAGLDKAVLAGIFRHDFGLPGEAELQKLLVSRIPSGNHMPGGFDVGSFPDSPTSVTAQEATAEALAASDKSVVEAAISPQVFEAELQKLFAADAAATGRIPNSAAVGSIPGIPTSPLTPGLTGSLSDVEASVPAVPSSQVYGHSGEAELQKLQAVQPASGSIIPASVDTGSIPAFPSSLMVQELTAESLTDSGKSVEAVISPEVFEAELQKLFAANTAATGEIPRSAGSVGSSIEALPTSTATTGLNGSRAGLDPALIAGLSPEVYGLPGEAELLKFFAPLTPPSGNTPESVVPGSSFYFLDESKNRGFNAPALASAHPPFDVHVLRRDFPILKERVNGYPLAWLDNAATTQKPQVVIDRVSYFYEHENSNVHRAAHELAARATDAYEKARDTVAHFLNAPSAQDIIFVRGTTEGINLVAQSWGRQNLLPDDEIVITWLEHHANIVPWQQLSEVTGAKLRVVPVDDSGQVLLGEFQKLLNSRTKLVSFTHVSNALGTVTPAQEIIAMAHRVGARVLLDAAQSVSHLHVDVQELDCDWCVFSGHKIFGPTGIGAVYGKAELLESMPPWQGGGNMIEDVTFEKTIYQPAPVKFEAGTGNIADAVGLGAALEYLTKIGIHNVARYEHELLVYAMEALRSIPGLRLIGTAAEKTSVLSFVLAGHSNQDIGVALNKVGIAVRTGHHCAQPILRRFGLESTVRPSLAFYNTYEEIDRLVSTVRRIQGGNII